MSAPALYLALVHHPVRARDGSTVTTAVTNLDVHDLARLARTYGAKRYYVVTPIAAQRAQVDSILAHWREGEPSASRIPERADALSLVETCATIDDARAAVERLEGRAPRVLATAARPPDDAVICSFDEARAELRPLLVLFGTGHGLAPDALRSTDGVLPAIRPGDFNHLSVRTAAAILLDRLLADD